MEIGDREFATGLAYAITIHKSQGLTVPVAKMEIGDRDFEQD